MALSLSKRMFLAGSCLQINFIFGGYCVCSKGHGVCFLWSSECAPMCLIPMWASLLVKGETVLQKWKSKCPLLSATNTHSDTSRIFFLILKVYSFDLYIWYIYICMYACMHIWVFSLCICLTPPVSWCPWRAEEGVWLPTDSCELPCMWVLEL